MQGPPAQHPRCLRSSEHCQHTVYPPKKEGRATGSRSGPCHPPRLGPLPQGREHHKGPTQPDEQPRTWSPNAIHPALGPRVCAETVLH